MIVIAGDSWACGEWNEKTMGVAHRGIAEYFSDDGHLVFNIGQPSGTNYNTVLQIEKFLVSLITTSFVKDIFVFQTEWIRDYTGTDKVKITKSLREIGYQDLKNYTISEFYYSLSDIAQRYNVRIKLIGGCSDVLFLDQFSSEYPSLEVACQSLVNLCVKSTDKISEPVFEISKFPEYEKRSSIIKKVKPYSNTQDIENFLFDQQLAEDRVDLFTSNPQWFYPDGLHANRKAHKVLYNFLRIKYNY